MPREYQTRLPFEAAERERFQLLDNLRFLGRSTRSAHVRQLVELVGRVAGEDELMWTVDGAIDSRDCLCSRLNMTPRTMRRTIQDSEYCGALLVRRCRRADRSYDRLALRVNWRRLAARELIPLAGETQTANPAPVSGSPDDSADPAPVSGSPDDLADPAPVSGSLDDSADPAPVSGSPDDSADPAPVSGSCPGAMASGAPVRPNWPHGVAKLAAPERPNWPHGVAKLAAQYKQDKQIPPPPPKAPATATAADPCGDTGRDAWAVAAECLQRTGFASWRRLLSDARQLQVPPEQLCEACETYLAQRERFRGPGALAFWVQNLRWPVDGILPPEQALARSQTVQRRTARDSREQAASRIVYAGRKAGKSDDQIGRELAAVGLEWA